MPSFYLTLKLLFLICAFYYIYIYMHCLKLTPGTFKVLKPETGPETYQNPETKSIQGFQTCLITHHDYTVYCTCDVYQT